MTIVRYKELIETTPIGTLFNVLINNKEQYSSNASSLGAFFAINIIIWTIGFIFALQCGTLWDWIGFCCFTPCYVFIKMITFGKC